MKIIVCLKQTAARDTSLKFADGAVWPELEATEFETNEPDSYALEEALRLKDDLGAEVVALTAGAQRAGKTIREALAKGADRGIHVEDDSFAGPVDSLTTASALATAIRDEAPDLILTGLQSDDSGYGQTGVVLAELLGLPHATLIVELKTDGSSLEVKRELEGGWFQRLRLPLPALLTIQSGINKPRYATLMGIKRAKKKPVRNLQVEQLGALPESGLLIRRIATPRGQQGGVTLEGTPAEQASQLLAKLREEKVL